MARVEHDLTDAQWVALKAAWGGCAYCHKQHADLQKDCALPISVGGRYTLVNVVRPAVRAMRASATPRSPRGCAARSSTRAHS
jgi:hypothetical protein